MKLAISNIAWPLEEERRVAAVMGELGIRGVEVAPTKPWPAPLEATPEEVRSYRASWNDRGIEIVALQALLFGRPELTVFESAETRARTLDYLKGIAHLGAQLGARALVFGSPRSRRVGALPREEALAIAIDFFRAAGESAAAEGVMLCVEPNPTQYECDFVTESAEGLELVRAVDSAGFGLHLDAAGMTLSGEDLPAALEACSGAICHFHVSEPFLGPIGEGGVDHATIAATLRRIAYPGWVSVEMRHDPDRETVSEIRHVLELLAATYS